MANMVSRVGLHRATLAAAIAAAIALAAGCGGSSSSSSTPSNAVGSASSSVSSAASSAASSASTSVASGSSFCASAKKAGVDLRREIQGIAASANSPPSKVKQELTATLGTLTGIQNSAPAQIKPDIGVFVDYITQLQSVLAKHNYSVLASVPELQTLQAKEAKLHTATAHIDAWGKANGCSS